ncbi:Ribonuclease III [hydrothermal vent metagenome]|uniref:ribonuclease III n=1 Tax=hydrothermal vent metagenome TaxID=652676 RepID=A0A3B0YV43_9ZZZZ
MNRSLDGLVRSLDCKFQQAELLEAAVTHRSAGSRNNERLEFLGDAVLGFVVAELLFEKFPDASEGQLSRLRASLVKRDTLADVARELDLGDYLRLGSGELKSGGFRRDSILADALEAILGAILLDSGYETCRDSIHQLFAVKIDGLSSVSELKDPKTLLQEFLQSRRLSLPVYEITSVSGKAHQQHFVVECKVVDLDLSVTGEGNNRRGAEQAAARRMLDQVNVDG